MEQLSKDLVDFRVQKAFILEASSLLLALRSDHEVLCVQLVEIPSSWVNVLENPERSIELEDEVQMEQLKYMLFLGFGILGLLFSSHGRVRNLVFLLEKSNDHIVGKNAL